MNDFASFPRQPHKPVHLKARRVKKKIDHNQFISWDGEGITDSDGKHHYVIFANSNGKELVNSLGLSTISVLAALIESERANPKGINVIYYGSYDFNMILKDVPRATLERLRHGHRAYFADYNLQVRFGKRLWVKNRLDGTSITLWDVGSFFQQSFVKSLRTWEIGLEHIENIEAQKANRSNFDQSQLNDMLIYCRQELSALVELMQAFNTKLKTAGIRLGQWHGPGAIAANLYKQHSIKSHKEVCPPDVNLAAQYAFGAGRIELGQQGHYDGTVYNYDINSAYPAAIATLPSLANGTWVIGRRTSRFTLYRIKWRINGADSKLWHKFYPLRHRYKNGSITYPGASIGNWVWEPEFRLMQAFYPGSYEVLDILSFDPNNDATPFTWVEDMYYKRRELKQAGDGAERILKLGLNSLYGKMIQQVGWKTANELPPFHQLEWGGYVTSWTRAQLYEAAYGSNGIIGFETDGILSTVPLDLPLSDELGGWSLTEHQGITYVQNGFYWLGNDKVKYRGFDPGSVTHEQVLAAWASGQPTLTAQLTRHIGLNYAAHTGHWDDWGNWVTTDRELDIASASSKRIHLPDLCDACKKGLRLDQALHQTMPYGIGATFSYPYPLEWRTDEPFPDWKEQAKMMDNELVDYDTWRYS